MLRMNVSRTICSNLWRLYVFIFVTPKIYILSRVKTMYPGAEHLYTEISRRAFTAYRYKWSVAYVRVLDKVLIPYEKNLRHCKMNDLMEGNIGEKSSVTPSEKNKRTRTLMQWIKENLREFSFLLQQTHFCVSVHCDSCTMCAYVYSSRTSQVTIIIVFLRCGELLRVPCSAKIDQPIAMGVFFFFEIIGLREKLQVLNGNIVIILKSRYRNRGARSFKM